MHAYRTGDAAAFEELYSRYRKPLYQFVLNSCKAEAIAQELYQDVWMRVIQSHQSFDENTPFHAWLFRIARNRIIDYYRKHKEDTVAPSVIEDSATQANLWSQAALTPHEVASLSQRAGALHNALQEIPSEQREAILLKHIAGMSINEIAELLDEGAQTVKSRLRYAKAKLRTQLKILS